MMPFMGKRLATTNLGPAMPSEDRYLQVTVAFAPYDRVMPVVAGLFRAEFGFSRVVENDDERQWARLDRLERARGTEMGTHSENSTRVIEPKDAPDITVIEDFMGTDPKHLGALLPDVSFLHLFSEYARKNAERHSYTWRKGAKILRHVYFHHNYQYPGWDWQAKGPVQPWEDTERMTAKRVSKRCDRALMLDYANRLGCDLHAVLAQGASTRNLLLYGILDTDTTETPPPTTLGEAARKEAVKRRFGFGEEGVTFKGQLADAHFFACLRAHTAELSAAIHKTRSAKSLLQVMSNRDIAPDWQDPYCSDMNLWCDALLHAYRKFPDAPETREMETRAKAETQAHRFPISDIRLRNLSRSLRGEAHEFDPAMMAGIFGGLQGR